MIEFINGIIPNICILLTLTLIYSYILKYISKYNFTFSSIISGIMFGIAAIYGMMTPYILSPGLIFDGRSIILCSAGIVIGFPGTLTAILVAVFYRFCIGGSGGEMGIFVITTSGFIGYFYGRLRRDKLFFNKVYFIYFTGIIVHIFMLLGTLLLPSSIRYNTLFKIYLPLLTIYPFATLLFTLILDHQIKIQKQYDELVFGRIRLKQSFIQSLSAISKAIEAKDEYTKDHQQRVANLAVQVAIARNWSSSQILEVYIAALFHDIGKLIIPITILNKPNKLIDSEFEIIKQHTIKGYDIFHQLDFYPWKIDDIILQHHEKLDGSGYPNGISGDKIHKAAKLLTVCDTFDALTTNRAYRKALTFNQAISELKKGSGIIYEEKYLITCINIVTNKNFDIRQVPIEFNNIFCQYYSTNEINI